MEFAPGEVLDLLQRPFSMIEAGRKVSSSCFPYHRLRRPQFNKMRAKEYLLPVGKCVFGL
jgi:hypothetical protein